ncbi:MAG: TatD family hydrolase [Opitutales bacterium]
MDLIDSHCHLQSFQNRGDLDATLERAAAAGVRRFITVGTSPEDWVTYREMHTARPQRISYSVGLHPGSVDEEWSDAVSQLSTFFAPPNCPVAFGEIGLDYFHLPQDPVEAGDIMLLQESAFRRQLSLAGELDVPVIIHSRDAFNDTFRMIDESEVAWSRIVFHCYSYGPDEIEALNERGARASFTGIATYKSAKAVREALQKQGIERLMLETDCPYLAPEPHRGKTNEPAFLKPIAASCADALGLPAEELAERTTANTRSFFGLR